MFVANSFLTLWPHELQHTRLPCPSLSPKVCSNTHWITDFCLTILSSVVPFSSCPQSFPASRSFPMSQFFTSGGQITEAPPSASVLPMNIQGWFPLGLIGLISFQSKGLSRYVPNYNFLYTYFFFCLSKKMGEKEGKYLGISLDLVK